MFPEIPNYQIIEEVGRGGMATVYKAWQPSLSRTVALKVLPSYFAHEDNLVMRFRREAHAVAKLRHPNIVQVFDFCREGDQFYLVMEYVSGGSLESWLAEEGKLSIEDARRVVRQVAEGLHHAHTKGFIHRDIKPSNILISEGGDAVITDFGIVKALESTDFTKTADRGIGTSEYMSPEQSRGEKVDARTDLYSLGVVFYESLTGKPPFNGANSLGVLNRQVNDEPLKPSLINPEISPEAERIILKLLAKEPVERYATGLELVAAVNSLSSVPPVDPFKSSKGEKPVSKLTLIRRDTRVAVRKILNRGAKDRSTGRGDLDLKDIAGNRQEDRAEPALKIGGIKLVTAATFLALSFAIGFAAGFLVLPQSVERRAEAGSEVKSKKRAEAKQAAVEKKPRLVGVEVDPVEVVMTVDETLTLMARGVYNDGSKKGIEVSWKLSDESLAEIDREGNLTAKKAGSLEAEAKSGDYRDIAKIGIVEKQSETTETTSPPEPAPEPQPVKRRRPTYTPKPSPEPAPAPEEPQEIPLFIN